LRWSENSAGSAHSQHWRLDGEPLQMSLAVRHHLEPGHRAWVDHDGGAEVGSGRPVRLDGDNGQPQQHAIGRRDGGGAVTHLASGKMIASEAVLYATGRQGATDKLGLEPSEATNAGSE
jgi:hypothetical protein